MTPKISALVITLNEAKNLPDLIKSLDFTDEIIIVDSFSSDNTLEILSQYSHIKVYQHKFVDFSSQRNIALKYATHDWILFLDADERISENLKNEIIETVSKRETKDGYYFKREFYFKNKKIHFSGLRTDKNLRLFKKENSEYSGLVHEKLNITNTGTLRNYLAHFSYTSYSHFREKIIYYNKLKALEKINKDYKPVTFMQLLHPVYTFFNKYLLRLGILDGKKGFIICKIYADGVKARYKEMKRIKKEQSN